MKAARRIYDSMLAEHLETHRQMAFVSGPRQVGKTTTCRGHSDVYVNWDNLDDREHILAGPSSLIEQLGLDRLRESVPTAMFDELHKFPQWKSFLKGLFDTHADDLRIIVTGSSRLDIYRRGGDSLMGRYFLYRMHPFSVAETLETDLPDARRILRPPKKIRSVDFEALWQHGGYPEPFLKRDPRFTRRWQSLRFDQLTRGDLRDMTQIQQLDQLATLVTLLSKRSAEPVVYQTLAKQIRATADTIRRWIDVLCNLQLGFLVRPWYKNVTRSLRKEPKWYLRDWSSIEDPGHRAETLVGCHLLKAVQGWTDLGLGTFDLHYVRDKEKREVDFLVTRDGKPWFLTEVKLRSESIGRPLGHYQSELNVPFAFQVTLEAASEASGPPPAAGREPHGIRTLAPRGRARPPLGTERGMGEGVEPT